MSKTQNRVRLGCYCGNLSMAVVGNLSPLLFLTFRQLYGISYSLLGLLVLINFCTQLLVDLIFSFFSHKFNIHKTVKLTPLLTVTGFLAFALLPEIFVGAEYVGLIIGTVIFSTSSGLLEVLLSPVIAALPSPDPDREMSKLHSIYAWGVVAVVIISTVFIRFAGAENWKWLAIGFTIIPLCSFLLLLPSELPTLSTPEKTAGALRFLKQGGVWLSVFAIFLGGAAECIMAQWCSGYAEAALKLPKLWGDLFGAALFALALGLGRSLYAKYGKNIYPVLFFCALGATLCYLTAALSANPVIGIIACGLTGLFTSMLWPGNLIAATDRYASGGVLIFALMAAGGDFGAALGPQIVGIITDLAIASPKIHQLSLTLGITAEQIGMKMGMLTGLLFPLCAVAVFTVMWRGKIKRRRAEIGEEDKTAT